MARSRRSARQTGARRRSGWELTRLVDTHFKGWAKPGPIPPGALSPPDVPPDETLDAISGHFRIFQLRDGHRFSTDDVLTAWYGTSWAPSASRVLDLGSGIGSVGMIAAWRLPGARFVTIEAQEDSVRLARKSAAYNGLASATRFATRTFAMPAALGANETFDLVLGSPPYFPLGTGIEGDHPQKVACRFELRGDICRLRARCGRRISPRVDVFACVFPEDQRDAPRGCRARSGCGSSSGAALSCSAKANRRWSDLFLMMRATDLPPGVRDRTWVEPPLDRSSG